MQALMYRLPLWRLRCFRYAHIVTCCCCNKQRRVHISTHNDFIQQLQRTFNDRCEWIGSAEKILEDRVPVLRIHVPSANPACKRDSQASPINPTHDITATLVRYALFQSNLSELVIYRA
jgi:hypothetical protein